MFVTVNKKLFDNCKYTSLVDYGIYNRHEKNYGTGPLVLTQNQDIDKESQSVWHLRHCIKLFCHSSAGPSVIKLFTSVIYQCL